jgi:hypothetical protein
MKIRHGDELEVDLVFHPNKLKAGKYTVVTTVTAPYLNKQVTEATVTRFAFWNALLGPLLAVVLGSLGGLGLAAITAKTTIHRRVKVSLFWLGAAAAVALIGGGWVIYADYLNDSVEVWKFPGDFFTTMGDAFAAATAAVGTAMATRIWQIKRKARRNSGTRQVIAKEFNVTEDEAAR